MTLWRSLQKRPFLISYLLIVVAVVGGFIDQRSQDQRTRRQSAAICTLTRNSWDERDALVLTITTPTVLSPAIARDLPTVSAVELQRQIDANNVTKTAERVHLLVLQGPRPRC